MTALRFLALGDSYTIGEGVARHEGWPQQWCAALRRQGIAIEDPRVIAQSGWTTDELAQAIDAAEPLGEWDIVSLLIGVNNQYRQRDLENYRLEFSVLLERAILLAGRQTERVFVLSIPDWGITPFGQASGRDTARISNEIDAFNTINRALCAMRGVRWLNITEDTRRLGALPQMLTADGLHPSAAMYHLWVQRLSEQFPLPRKELRQP